MRTYSQRGFTLPEVIVTTVIVIILTSISIGFVYEIRKEGRDARRIADLEQLEVVFKLYADQYRGLPDCNSGIQIEPGGSQLGGVTGGIPQTCNDGAQLLTFIEETMREIPTDPLGPGNPDYYYYYDGGHNCSNAPDGGAAMLFAVNMEGRPGNAAEKCGTISGNDGGYVKTGNSTNPPLSGTIDPSNPYVIILQY